MELGVLTLLPPVIILAVALYTRNTTSSLLIGAAVCCILQYGTGFLGGFILPVHFLLLNPSPR